jgi:ribosomal protein L29|tara:strand:- start:402 stop:722 length:321 start_codon:yes stop_codon:yes gene_type:complete
MAIENKKEMARMSSEQLTQKYGELKKELMKLNMQRASGTPPENPGMIKATKKAIARINTFMTQRKNTKNKEKTTEKKEITVETKKVVKKVVKNVIKKQKKEDKKKK